MAQFRGSVQGSRGEASRLGGKSSGMRTQCDTWSVGVTCQASEDDSGERIDVYRTNGSGHALSTRWIATVYPDGRVETRRPDGEVEDMTLD